MLKRAMVVLAMLAIAAFVYAADVALVTWVEGEVSASIQDDTSEDAHEWLVEAAEMLPVDAEIMVHEESSLKFVHFNNNVEYSFEADAWLQITEDGVLSEQDFASSALQMVSAKLELDSSMRQQVGAVIADAQPVQKPRREDSSASPVPSSPMRDSFDELVVPSPSVPSAASEIPTTLQDDAGPVSVMLALPLEIAQLLAADISTLKVVGHEAEVSADVEGWVVVQLTLPLSEKLALIKLEGDSNYLQTRLHAVELEQDSMVQAWRFEKQNLLPQAAALWIEQASSGVEMANTHLDRLKALMLDD